jgi:saccharopine dehydrogenase-like NADP-dependent oxidoreductase
MRVVVLGGTGNFGARIVRALHREPGIEVVAASRSGAAVVGAVGVRTVALDVFAPELQAKLVELAPTLVVHTVGPFQGQDYRVAQAALAAGAHYLDLADGREFVCAFAGSNHARALAARRLAISGASTLPALSVAVIEALREGLRSIEQIEIAIAPGQLAVRGAATLAAVFSYLGRPILVWRKGQWETRYGWMDIRRVALSFGARWGALCDVPDLTLIPARYPDVKDVRFYAALEFRLQHAALWVLAALRRLGLPFAVDRWARALDRVSAIFNPLAGAWGGMRVSMVGNDDRGRPVRRTWELKVPAADGPEIPTFAAIVLARRIARGENMELGATPCAGRVRLGDFAEQFTKWQVTTSVVEWPGK